MDSPPLHHVLIVLFKDKLSSVATRTFGTTTLADWRASKSYYWLEAVVFFYIYFDNLGIFAIGF